MPKGIYDRNLISEKNKLKRKKGRYDNCIICGNPLWRTPSEIKKDKHKFCSNECYWISKLGKPSPLKGRPGKPATEETKLKLSRILKGRKKGPFSEEHKRRISESKMGNIPWNKGKNCKTKLYAKWDGMKTRCLRNSYRGYERYGGRGIKVCIDWLVFDNFKKDMEESYETHVKEHGEKNTSLDRIDVNGNYELSNCRWATAKVQQNNKSNNHQITYRGKTLNLSQWSEVLDIKLATLYSRIVERGWSVDKAFNEPIRNKIKV